MEHSEKAFLNILSDIKENLEAIEHMMDNLESEADTKWGSVSENVDVVQQAENDITAWIATVETATCGKPPLVCTDCGGKFQHVSSYSRHMREAKHCILLRRSRGADVDPREFGCDHCQRTFTRPWDLSRHMSRFHSS